MSRRKAIVRILTLALCCVILLITCAAMLLAGCAGDLQSGMEPDPLETVSGGGAGAAAAEAGSLDAGDKNGSGGVDLSADPDEKTDEAPAETVTIKADPAGVPQSAVLKRSDDDMEEKLDPVELEKLPFSVSVRYYLDGQELTPEEIAGASGPVRIRFDYENQSEANGSIVPFAFLSMVIFPEDRFSDIEVTNGDVSTVQDNQIAFGYALPGIKDQLAIDALKDAADALGDDLDELEDTFDDFGDNKDKDKKKDDEKDSSKKEADSDQTDADADQEDKDNDGEEDEELFPEYVEITANAEDFKLDFTATIVTNGLLSDTRDDTFEDLRELTDGLLDVAEAGDDLEDGTKELHDGAGKFQDGLSQYVNGASALAKGAAQLSEGTGKLSENSEALTDGAAQLADGLNELNKAVSAVDLSDLTQDSREGDDGSGSALPIDAEALARDTAEAAFEAALAQLSGNENLSEEDKAAAAQAAASAAAQAAVSGAAEGLQSAVADMTSGDGASQIKEQLGQLEQLKSGIASLAGGAGRLLEGIKSYTGGVDQVAEGASQLAEGASRLSSAGGQLTDGFDAMEDGIGELADGFRDLNQKGMQKIGKLAENELTGTIDRFEALVKADQMHTAYGVFDGEKDSGTVRYIVETEEVKRK